jgi:hypothetical protein
MGEFYRRAVCEVVLGCGVVMMEQVTRDNRCDGEGAVLLAVMATMGALQKGVGQWWCAAKGAWAAVVRMEASTRAGGGHR